MVKRLTRPVNSFRKVLGGDALEGVDQVALQEAAQPAFTAYAHAVVANARSLAGELTDRGFDLVTGGTDTHLMLVDLTSKRVPGKQAAKALDRAGIVVNCNTVPFDTRSPFDPSGIRLGTSALTSRGLDTGHMAAVAAWIDRAVKATHDGDEDALTAVRGEVAELPAAHPAPGLPVG